MWTKEEELKNQQLHLRCEKSNSPPKLFLFLIRIFTRTFSFAFSAARTPHIALHSTHNVCLVCTIVRGFREVRRNRFASDRASPRYDFPFFESFLFLFFVCVKIAWENRGGRNHLRFTRRKMRSLSNRTETNFPHGPKCVNKSLEKLTLASLPKQERRRSQKTNVEESVFQSQSGGARRRLVRVGAHHDATRFVFFNLFLLFFRLFFRVVVLRLGRRGP